MRVAVLGATGYTGAELLRLLAGHPHVQVTRVIGHGTVGKPVAAVLPSLAGAYGGDVRGFAADDVAASADAAFCALPHGASAPVVKELRARGVKVFDLSADFRLRDLAVHEQWYGKHAVPELVPLAVYGSVELHREELKTADLVAVAGCYPTASVFAVAPLLHAQLVEPEGIVVDAKSGVSGAGRSPTAATHLPETAESIRAYKSGGTHRHTPEIEQELSRIAGREVRVLFTPHLVPMTRGILASAYATARMHTSAERCTEAARSFFAGSPSVVVLDPGANPDTLWVRGSNRVHLSYAVDARTNRVLAQATLDNLVKGAAGQAIQCLNVRFGLEEAAGLTMPALWP